MESSRICREHPLHFAEKSGSTPSYDRTSHLYRKVLRNLSHVPFMAESLRLSEQQRADLDEIAPSPFLPAGVVFRAKLILRVADEPVKARQARLQTIAPSISR